MLRRPSGPAFPVGLSLAVPAPPTRPAQRERGAGDGHALASKSAKQRFTQLYRYFESIFEVRSRIPTRSAQGESVRRLGRGPGQLSLSASCILRLSHGARAPSPCGIWAVDYQCFQRCCYPSCAPLIVAPARSPRRPRSCCALRPRRRGADWWSLPRTAVAHRQR